MQDNIKRMEELKTPIPWAKVLSYLSLKELCGVRLVSRLFHGLSMPLFNKEHHHDTQYTKCIGALMTKHLTNAVCTRFANLNRTTERSCIRTSTRCIP